MANFKTLSLAGVMLVSTTGVGVAQTPVPLNLTICCPTSIPPNACKIANGNFSCTLLCNGTTCTAGSLNNFTWGVLGAGHPPVQLLGAKAEMLDSMLTCTYSGGISAMYQYAPDVYIPSQTACNNGTKAGFILQPSSKEGKKYRPGTEKK